MSALGLAAVLTAFLGASGQADVVSSLTEQALRSAVRDGGTVTFASSGTLTLSAPITVATNVVLDGAGAVVTLSGGQNTALFHVVSNLTLLNLTLTGGRATSGGCLLIRPGGAVLASDCVFSGHQAVGANGQAGADGAANASVGRDGAPGGAGQAALGGAILNEGRLVLLNCRFLTNTATGGNGGPGGDGGNGGFEGGDGGRGGDGGPASGGAVYSLGALLASNCLFSGNTASGGDAGAGGAGGTGPFSGHAGQGGSGGAAIGGGLGWQGEAVLVNCAFVDNQAHGGDSAAGGQLANGSGRAGAAGGDALGGGLWCAGTGNVTNTTFAANAVVGGNGGNGGNATASGFQGGDGGAGGWGLGGSAGTDGTLRMVNCTVVGGNSVGGLGGLAGNGPFAGKPGADAPASGANLANRAGSLWLKNSIIANPGSGTNTFLTTNVVAVTTNVATDVWVVSTNTFGIVNGICDQGVPPACYTNLVFVSGSTVVSNLFLRTNCLGTSFPAACLTNLVFSNLVTSNFTFTVWVTNVVSLTNTARGFNAEGLITDAGHNLSTDHSPAFGPLSRNGADPKLGPLADNGGPCPTFALLAGSPALNAGDDAACPSFDQRGRPRPTGGRSDIGAVEMGAPVILTQPQSQTVSVGAPVQFSVVATGEAALAYQWRLNGTNLAGATAPQLSLPAVRPTDAGDYGVLVSNQYGVATSRVAGLTVTFSLRAVEPVLLGDGRFAFRHLTSPGRRYVLEARDTLEAARWMRLDTNTGTGTWLSWQLPTTNAASRFFRVAEE